ncbi:DUF748 domain-containing protein [Robertkochia flava]|uniref:DUF748 domain-containing protein n=1 Tax=Robertkochia flava TaxID=3447986 RepID=UPI001CCFC806|nr:DUF748 domain-containing protein [Robertkochia marina]
MSIRKTTLRNIFVIALGVILVFLILLPGIVRRYVVNNSKELLGRQVAIEKLRINYLTSTLKVFDFKMYEANDKEVFISFDTLIVNSEPYKFIGKTLSLDQFYLRGLNVQVSKRDSVFNFDDLVAYHSSPDTLTTEDEGEDSPFKFELRDMELKDATLEFHDQNVDQTFGVEDLVFFVPYIEWDQENNSEADFELNFKRGGTLRSDFTYQPKTRDFQGSINLDKMPLEAYGNYVAQSADISSLDGKLNAEITLRGNSQQPDEILISGEIEVDNLELKDTQDKKFLGAAMVECTIDEIAFAKKEFRLGQLVVDQPYIRFELDSVSNNFSRIFRVDSPREATAEESAEAGEDSLNTEMANKTGDTLNTSSGGNDIFYALRKFQVKNGVLDYTDNLTGEPFDYHLSEIEIDTDSIYSDTDWLDINADMVLNERGTLDAALGFDPGNPKNLDLDIAIKDFVLSDLNIYSTYYTGHSILKGDMFYFSDSKVADGKIESNNTLLVKDVSVENTESGIMSIPLKLAVFILKDKNGDIELSVPVRGDLNDPEVDIWDLVGNTFKKKIFDTAENPARGLAKVVDAAPEDIEVLFLNYPDTTLTERHQEQLDLILELEEKKNGLGIELSFMYDKEVFMDSLFKKQEKGVGSISGGSADQAKAELTVAGNLPEEAELDTVLADYGRSFRGKIENYIEAKNSNSGIIVRLAELSDPSQVETMPQFKVKYTLREEENPERPSGDSQNSNKGEGDTQSR